jgi:hypothetical protein
MLLEKGINFKLHLNAVFDSLVRNNWRSKRVDLGITQPQQINNPAWGFATGPMPVGNHMPYRRGRGLE